MKTLLYEPKQRPGLPVLLAGYLSALLWMGKPFYLQGIGMQITHLMSFILVLIFLIYKISSRDHVLLRIGQRLILYILMVVASLLSILAAGILSGFNAASLQEVAKFEAGYLMGFAILTVFISALTKEEELAFIHSCFVLGGTLVVASTFMAYIIPPLGDIMFNRFGRAQGFVLHPNQFGMMLAAAVPVAAAHLAADAYKRVSRWFILAVLLAGVVISGSKTNILLCVFLCPLTLLTASRFEQQQYSKRLFSLLGALLVTGLGGFLGVILLPRLAPQTLLNLQIFLSDPESYRSFLSRWDIWEGALTIVPKHPYIGIGAGNTPMYLEVRHCHNVFIEFYLTMGCIGLAALVFFIFSILAVCRYTFVISRHMAYPRRVRIVGLIFGLISYLLSNQLSDSFGPTTMPVLWVLLGTLLAEGNSWLLEEDIKNRSESAKECKT